MSLNKILYGYTKLIEILIPALLLIFFSSIFLSKQTYKLSFYVLLILGLISTIGKVVSLSKSDFKFPRYKFYFICVLSIFLCLYFSYFVNLGGEVYKSGAFFYILFIPFFFLYFYSSQQEKCFYIVFLAIFATALVSATANGMTMESYGDLESRFTKYLAVLILVPLFKQANLKVESIFIVLGIATFIFGLIAVLDYWFFDSVSGWMFDELEFKGRASGNTHPIYFATIVAGIVGIFISYIIEVKQSSKMWKLFSIVVVIIGLLAVVLTKARGVWIAIPICILTLFWISKSINLKAKYLMTVFILVFIAIASQISVIKERVNEVHQDIEGYMYSESSNDNARSTSVALRFEMWRAAYMVFMQSPLLGVGPGNYNKSLEKVYSKGNYHPNILIYRHPHNEYLAVLAERGVIGLMSILLFLSVIFVLFFNAISVNKSERNNFAALSSVFVVLLFAIGSLTSQVFDHKYLLIFFIIISAILFSMIEDLKFKFVNRE